MDSLRWSLSHKVQSCSKMPVCLGYRPTPTSVISRVDQGRRLGNCDTTVPHNLLLAAEELQNVVDGLSDRSRNGVSGSASNVHLQCGRVARQHSDIAISRDAERRVEGDVGTRGETRNAYSGNHGQDVPKIDSRDRNRISIRGLDERFICGEVTWCVRNPTAILVANSETALERIVARGAQATLADAKCGLHRHTLTKGS